MRSANREIPQRMLRGQRPSDRFLKGGAGHARPKAKTKTAICFLCLFDGFRTPSIRRLVRRPRVIFSNPLLTFDPAFYAPTVEKALIDEYKQALNCPCEMAVDPSAQKVLEMMRPHVTSMPPQRVIIHYCGQGCHEPEDGNIYFFTDDHMRYKPVKADQILSICACPTCFIFDCPNAGSLIPYFVGKRDVIAFFSCGIGEKLPLSVETPMDLFSACLLKPFETALWWHKNLHRNVVTRKDDEVLYADFLKEFLNGLLNTIALDTQTPEVCEILMQDPALSSLLNGFVLAQRIMMSFNIHPKSIPDMKLMTSHPLWNTWDIALDMSASMNREITIQTIFDLIVETFRSYPSPGLLPIFSFFVKQMKLQEEACRTLFDYMDSTDYSTEIGTKCNIAKAILNLEHPTEISLLLLAKIIASTNTTVIDGATPLYFAVSSDTRVLKAGMMAVICMANTSYHTSLLKTANVCLQRATECAPYSALLFGLLVDKSGGSIAVVDFSLNFIPMLESPREDVRACACYVLGYSKVQKAVSLILPLLRDESYIVRIQAFIGLLNLYKSCREYDVFEDISELESDPDENVKSVYERVKCLFGRVKMGTCDLSAVNPIIPHVVHSIRSAGFSERLENLFGIAIPSL